MKFSKLFAVIITSLFIAHAAMAAFTNNNYDDSKNKYSLKHLNKLSNNYLSFQQKYRTAQTTNSFFYKRESNGLSMSTPVNTYLLSQKTTTTFVYPYKFTAKVPKFKTPSRPPQ